MGDGKKDMNEQVLGRDNLLAAVDEDRYALLEELMTQYGQDVINLVYAYVKDRMQAEDIAQDAFLKAFTHLDQFQGKSSYKTWMYTIAINCAKDYLRSSFFRRWRPAADPVLETKASGSSAEDHVMESWERQAIWEAVLQLPVKYREAVVLYYREELTVSEISQILDMGEGAIRTRLRRARDLLKKKIGKVVNEHGPV
jgi:RNA polymerase sigma-70 factor (ECF subfamily)